MPKAISILLICIIFMVSHLAETVEWCHDGDAQESIAQSITLDGHNSISPPFNDSDNDHGCNLSCHHCHHGCHFSFRRDVSKVSFVEILYFNFSVSQTAKFEFDLLRPPALT